MNKAIKIKIPILPNFLLDEKGNCYPISDFYEEEIRELGKEWIDELVKKAKKNKI